MKVQTANNPQQYNLVNVLNVSVLVNPKRCALHQQNAGRATWEERSIKPKPRMQNSLLSLWIFHISQLCSFKWCKNFPSDLRRTENSTKLLTNVLSSFKQWLKNVQIKLRNQNQKSRTIRNTLRKWGKTRWWGKKTNRLSILTYSPMVPTWIDLSNFINLTLAGWGKNYYYCYKLSESPGKAHRFEQRQISKISWIPLLFRSFDQWKSVWPIGISVHLYRYESQ